MIQMARCRLHHHLYWVSYFADGIGWDARSWEAAVAGEVEGVTVGEIAVTEIAVVVEDSRCQKENLLGYAVGQMGLVSTVEPSFGLYDDFEGPVLYNRVQYFLEGYRMLDTEP
jgi:hypothetical protein